MNHFYPRKPLFSLDYCRSSIRRCFDLRYLDFDTLSSFHDMSFSDLPNELVRAIFEELFHDGWVDVLDWEKALDLRLVCSMKDHPVLEES
jgi:hypothetical protein